MTFTVTRRVEFGDTDLAGIVHFSNFFRYMESAETSFLRSLGLSVAWNEGADRYGFPRVRAECDYLKPARFEDELTVAVRVAHLGRKSVSYEFLFTRGTDEIAKGRITAVFCHKIPDGIEAREIPDTIRERLSQSAGSLS